MTRIYLLRHGETKWNREEIFRGRADIPLNEFGRLLGLSRQAFWKLRQDTACLNKLAYEDGSFILVRLNNTCHLNTMKQENRDF